MSNSRMVDAVNRLVGNILAGPGALFLPEVGSLRTERQPARRLSKRRILPPCRTVSFASQQQGVSLVDEIAAAAGVDGEKAAEIYRTWLGRVRQEERLEIEGVGTLVQKSFRLDPAFDRRLNPAGYEPVKIRSGRRFDFVLWLGVAAILFGVGFGGYWWWNDRMPSERRDVAVHARTTPGSEADRSVAAPEMSEDASGNGAATATVGGDPASSDAVIAAESASPESAAGDVAGTVTSNGAAAAAGDSAAHTGNSGNKQGAPVSDDEAADRAVRPAADPAETSDGGVLALVSGRRYVVLGVFSTAENAARAVRDAAAKEPALRCSVYRFGAKFMVSPFESDDAEACTLFIRAHAQTAPGMWTYTAR